jgi:hypothetical protein
MRETRLAVTESDGAARTASPALARLSRYPTRTASAVPGQVDSRPRRPTAASGPISCAPAAFVDAVRTSHEGPDRSELLTRLIQFVGSRP